MVTSAAQLEPIKAARVGTATRPLRNIRVFIGCLLFVEIDLS
jgi:hypothetical protein